MEPMDEQVPLADENDQIEQRRRSLDQIIQLGFDPYPHKFERSHSISQIVEQFSHKSGEELEVERGSAIKQDGMPAADNETDTGKNVAIRR